MKKKTKQTNKQKKEQQEIKKKNGFRKGTNVQYFLMINFNEIFCSNLIGILFWKAIEGISYRDPHLSQFVCLLW